MKEADFLFQLVQSLDDKEYKFVQEFARSSRGKTTQRELLLNDIRKQKEYNQQLLKPKYKSFEVLKFQVRQLVMLALRVHYENESVEQQIANHLQNERILYKKGFYTQAEKELEEALKLAEDFQKLGRLLEILQLLQFRIVERKTKDLPQAVADNFNYVFSILKAYQDQLAAFKKYQELFAKYRTEGTTELEDETIATLLPKRRDFYTELYRNAAESLEAQVKGDLSLAISLAEKSVNLFESEPEIADELQLKYKIQLANLGVLLVGGKRYTEVEAIIRKLKSIESKDFNEEAETFQNTIHLELLLMVNMRKFEGQVNLIQRVEDGLKFYDKKVNAARKLSIWYNLLVLYIVNENFDAAKKVIGNILDHKKFHVRKEIQYTTRLLELLIYFQLEIWDLPDHSIIAVRRYLERKDQLTDFKLLVIKNMQALVSAPINQRTEIFESLYKSLSEFAENDTQPDTLGLELVAAWTKSKFEKISIKECLRANIL